MIQKAHNRAEYRGGKHLYDGYSTYKNIHRVIVYEGREHIYIRLWGTLMNV